MGLLSDKGYGLQKFELDTDSVRDLLRSEEVQQMLQQEAESRCPAGCTVDVYVGTNRANARITTADADAYQDNLENNTLLKAIS